MKISPATITKVYSYYIGQFCEILSSSDIKLDVSKLMLKGTSGDRLIFEELLGFYPVNNFKLILKPLPQLTEADGREIDKFEGWKYYSKNNALSKETNPLDIIKLKLITKYDYNFITAQYLMSLGYDIPQYYLNNKTLIEAKLAKVK